VADGDPERGRTEMISVLSTRYFRPIDEGALAALPIDDLPTFLDDPYTHFLSKTEYDQFMSDERADSVGIGIDVVQHARRLVISRVFSGSPADVGGLQPGDVVFAIDGVQVTGLPLATSLSLVKGAEGTVVRITVDRAGTRVLLSVTRRRTGDWMVAAELRQVGDRSVGYLALLDFSEGVGALARSAVERLLAAGATRIVLDLRGNPGGWASEAVRVAEIFLPKGTAVLVERGANIDTTTYATSARPVDTRVSLAVLVDGDTASSAEIVSGALHDSGRATLVGGTTFGKGRIQDVVALRTGGAFKFTIAEYLTPNGFALDRRGIAPDVPIPADALSGVDLAYFAAATRA
jgi:carboxyl-terminal processing protease